MNDNSISKKNILVHVTEIVKSNLRNIIIFLFLCFVLFLSFQIYSFYNSNKIQKNSITFFSIQNIEDENLITKTITNLSKDNNFYGILSKLELIKINLEQKNYKESISLYLELLNSNNLDTVYRSAIAARATYQFIDINLDNLLLDYSSEIIDFLSYIDEKLDAYKGIRFELIYLTKILEVEKNSIEYKNFNEVIDIYNNIMNSDFSSSAVKERVNKIHEFYSNK
tara:strand:- start:15 stop:689 length:675 start_codon:yes stop_codon:yes gene_type:complete